MKLADYLSMESTYIEFKELVETKKAKNWLKSVSAFSNSKGGCLLFGVRDEDKAAVGLGDVQKAAEEISELVNARISPMPAYQVEPLQEDGKNFIVVEVEKGIHTPYYYVHEGTRVAYVRKGNQSVEAPVHELNNLILNGNNQCFDELPCFYQPGKVSFSVLEATYMERNPGEVFDGEKDLVSFGLKTVDGELTNAGALLCDQWILRQSRISCTRWKGTHKGSIELDALDDREYTGNLISLLENAAAFVKNNSKRRWKIRGLVREEEEDYPVTAVREAIVNALIHRDYQIRGSEVHLDIYDDRLEVYSPGGMVNGWRIQDLNLMKVQSVRRNPVIADVFGRLHFMDRKGSGIRRILDAYEGMPVKPEFSSEADAFFVMLPKAIYQLSPVSGNKRGKTQKQLDEILLVMRAGNTYSSSELAEVLQLSVSRVRQLLTILADQNLVRKLGGNKNRKYSRIQ